MAQDTAARLRDLRKARRIQRRQEVGAPTSVTGYWSRLVPTRAEDVPSDVALRFRHMTSGGRSQDDQMDVMRAFTDAFPGEGLAFLEDVAVPAWRELGVQVY